MAEFKESEHPRSKDGKFTTKGNGENKQNREKELLNKFIKTAKEKDLTMDNAIMIVSLCC